MNARQDEMSTSPPIHSKLHMTHYFEHARIEYIINLTITTLTSKIKKQKDTVSKLSKYYDIYLDWWLISRSKTNFNFQIFKLFTDCFQNKGQSKTNKERYDENNCLICFLRGQFLDSEAKTRGIALNIDEVLWELLRCWYTSENLKKKNCYFCKKFKLDKVV